MNDKNQNINEDLLVRFIADAVNETEHQLVQSWLLESDENKDHFDRVMATWNVIGKTTPKPVSVDVDAAWGVMSERVDQDNEQNTIRTKSIGRKHKLHFAIRIAASVIVLFGLYQFVQPRFFPKQIELVANNGILHDTLPDGSTVALKQYASLSYPERFVHGTRTVTMSGEAYFDVEPNEHKPFVITTDRSEVEVLGTSFSVSDSPNQPVEVVVESGLVRFASKLSGQAGGSEVKLPAGKSGHFSEESNDPIAVELARPDDLFWLNKRLIFRNNSLRDVFATLEQHFPIQIVVRDTTLLDLHYTSTFSNNSAKEILQLIAISFNRQLLIDEDRFIIN